MMRNTDQTTEVAMPETAVRFRQRAKRMRAEDGSGVENKAEILFALPEWLLHLKPRDNEQAPDSHAISPLRIAKASFRDSISSLRLATRSS